MRCVRPVTSCGRSDQLRPGETLVLSVPSEVFVVLGQRSLLRVLVLLLHLGLPLRVHLHLGRQQRRHCHEFQVRVTWEEAESYPMNIEQLWL